MYGLIFYFFYRYFLSRGDHSPRFGAICGVFLTIGLQLLAVYAVVQQIVGHNLLNPISKSYYYSKLLNMLIALPFLFLTIKFFNNKRTDEIISLFDNKQNVFSIINWTIFICL